MKQCGLTLLEVVIAIAIIAVAVLAAAMIQANALRSSGKATAIQRVTKLAEQELELRRQIVPTAGTNLSCSSTVASGYTCQVDVLGCQLSAGALSCSTGVTTPVAYQINVLVGGPKGDSVSLRTVY
jgi:prepilin-type N-terminal cleavage/methylation domain-containing protein